MGHVVIGMDPHKRSATIEVMAADESVLGGGRYGTGAAGYRAMLAQARRWPQRMWAIEGCQGIGRHIAHRLLADGEQVVDVPPKLSARTRVFATGQGRKTDATDVHSVALAATRMSGLRPVVDDAQIAVLRMLADRRRSLGEDHTRMISQLHQLLLELIPSGAKKDLSAAQAKTLPARVRARDAAGRARRRVAAELISDLERIYQRKKAADKELNDLLNATGTTLTSLNGIGPLRRRPAAGGGWLSDTVPGQGALRILERHRAVRRLLRRPGPPPPLPRRQPPDQLHPAHHGHRPAPRPHRRPRLLRSQSRRSLGSSRPTQIGTRGR
jgi:transposase